MSRTKLETRSVTILRPGLSKVALFLACFLLALSATALSWGEAHSFGNGPSFVIYPSVVVAGKEGQIKLRIFSPEKGIQYDFSSKKQKVRLEDSNVFKLNVPLDNPFMYLTVKGVKDWNTSTATVLVLSTQMEKMITDKPLSIFIQPGAFPTNLYIFVNSAFGRENLKVFLNDKKIENYQFSPVKDCAKMFKIPIENASNGIYKVKAQLSLITGQLVSATLTGDVTPPTISRIDVSPKIVDPKGNVKISVLAIDQSGVKSVRVNGIEATSSNNGTWVATLNKPFSGVTKSGTRILSLSITVSDTFGNATTAKMATKVHVIVPQPISLWVLVIGFIGTLAILLYTIF